MILNYAKLQALQIDTEVFYSGETLFKTIENKDKYGLIFLDIQLLQLDGVQVGKQIRERLGNEKISIVYISSKETYAMSLFQVRPLDFLIKPITQKTVNETIDKYIRLNNLILSILVDTFISKISLPMQPVPEIGSISVA